MHLGTPAKENKASGADHKVAQDLEHVNLETGLGSSKLLPEDTAKGGKGNFQRLGEWKWKGFGSKNPNPSAKNINHRTRLEKIKFDILNYKRLDPKYLDELRLRNAQSIETNNIPDNEYVYVMSLYNIQKMKKMNHWIKNTWIQCICASLS